MSLTQSANCQHAATYRCSTCGETKTEGSSTSHSYTTLLNRDSHAQKMKSQNTLVNGVVYHIQALLNLLKDTVGIRLQVQIVNMVHSIPAAVVGKKRQKEVL